MGLAETLESWASGIVARSRRLVLWGILAADAGPIRGQSHGDAIGRLAEQLLLWW